MVAVLALIVGATGCNGGDRGPRPRPTITEDRGAAALDRAIDGLNAARSAVVSDASAVIAAARSLDAGDRAGAAGDRAEMQRLRAQIDPRQAAARTAIRRLAARLEAYSASLDALDEASEAPVLDSTQRRAVTEVVRLGRLEHRALATFTRVTTGVWPSYLALYEDGSLWHTRSRAGWYRDTQEAANAYAVFVSDDRAALDRARRLLQQVDAERARAVAATATAIAAARTALVDLAGMSP